jgi:hypothetical protein
MTLLVGRRLGARECAFGLVFSLLCAGGCAPVYVAPAPNAPLFGSEGEVTAGAAIGTQGIDVQAGFAPVEPLAVIAAASFEGKGEDDDSIDHHHLYGEGAVGGFWPFGKAGRFEAFAGLGYGSSGGETTLSVGGEQATVASARGTFLRPFVQVDFGGAVDKFEGGIVLRVLQVRYHYDESQGEPVDIDRVQGFWEPFAFMRAGSRNVKFQLSGGFIFPLDSLGGGGSTTFVEWVPIHLSLGVHVRFGGKDPEEKPAAWQPPPATQPPPEKEPPPASQPPPVAEPPPASEPPPAGP